ncbi:MAG: hypothetical protein BWY10_02139 [Chloroflexi bacterium ADurb.Bin180]|nr:MAG: hypothetical protein BWY10_02139 [Chloroflexi bacterium ADurb.Bin180]
MRDTRVQRPSLEGLARAAKALLPYLLLVALTVPTIYWAFRSDDLRDLGSFLASGALASEGKNAYAPNHPLVFRPEFVDWPSVDAVNLNPPAFLWLFTLLARGEPLGVGRCWRIVTVGLYIVSVVLLARAYPRLSTPLGVTWALAFPGLWHTVDTAQVYALILLGLVLALLWMEQGHDVAAGVMLGVLASLKPNLALVIAALLVWRCRRLVFASAVAALIANGVTAAKFGWSVYADWLEATRVYGPAMVLLPANASLAGLTSRLGVPQLGVALIAILLILTVYWIMTHRPQRQMVAEVAVLVSLLVSPLTWSGYMVLTLPMFARWRWTRLVTASAVVLTIPFWIIIWLQGAQPVVRVLVYWMRGWGLVLLWCSLFETPRRSESSEQRGA